ncbi:MAG TPA: hypothetical protein VNJ70_09435 [Thermoanaerobaculia bacterium]|nr:hypothetical protein [Thermoanaerobaculia bacterium]
MSSKPHSEPLDLESALSTTARDVAALRRRATGENWLERVEALAFPDLFETRPRRRPIPAGREPFRLDDPAGDR